MNTRDTIIVLMKKNAWTALAKNYLCANFSKITIIEENYIWKLEWLDKQPDWIISYLCPVKIGKEYLDSAKKGAINFHPGPPEYPGIGCYNFAIMDNATKYGVTCHFMDEHFDSGPIIEVDYFELTGTETVMKLKEMSMVRLLSLFYRIMQDIYMGHKLVPAGIPWKRKAYTRKDLQDLCKLPIMVNTESILSIERRLRATYFPGALDSPYISINGNKWRLEPT